MGYTLRPSNKKIEELDFGSFIWPILLQETGMGYVLGYGANVAPSSYVYNSGRKGSPVSNDGYRVTSSEAKAMALVARGYVSVKRFINKQYEEASNEQQWNWENTLSIPMDNGVVIKLYTQKTGEHILEKLEKFADFAEKSKGFKID